jgi:hypothetical protein
MPVQFSTIDALRSKMKQAPEVVKEKRTISKQDAIRELKRDIDSMQRRGYTIEDIAQFLTEGGLPITTPTLKSYLQRVKGPKQKEARPVESTIQPDPAPAPERASIPSAHERVPPPGKTKPAAPSKTEHPDRKRGSPGGFQVRPDSDL